MPGPSAHRYPNAQLNPHTLLTPIPPSNLATQVVQVVVEKFLKIFINRYKSLRIVVLGGLGDDTNRVEMFLHPLAEHVKNKSESQSIVRMRLKQVTQFTNALVVAFSGLWQHGRAASKITRILLGQRHHATWSLR